MDGIAPGVCDENGDGILVMMDFKTEFGSYLCNDGVQFDSYWFCGT